MYERSAAKLFVLTGPRCGVTIAKMSQTEVRWTQLTPAGLASGEISVTESVDFIGRAGRLVYNEETDELLCTPFIFQAVS